MVWKFCWDLNKVISGGNWLVKRNCVFFRWDFVTLCELWLKAKAMFYFPNSLYYKTIYCEQMITYHISYTLKTLKNFMVPFYGWGSTASKLIPLWGGSLPFTTKFPHIPGTHFTNLGRMKGWVDLEATQVDSAFHPSEIGKVSTRNIWELNGKK